MITKKDLPDFKRGGIVVFDLDDGDTANVEARAADYFYGYTESFDFSGSADETVDKLNRWGAQVVGWE